MTGKDKCKILKDIRRKVAEENDIELVISECKYKGDCRGTCPKCESELVELENQLRRKQEAGKAIAVAAVFALGMCGTTVALANMVDDGDSVLDSEDEYKDVTCTYSSDKNTVFGCWSGLD